MIRKRLLVTNLLIYVFVALTLYFMQNLVFFDANDAYRSLTTSEYSLVFGLIFLVLGVTLYSEYKLLKRRPHWFFFFVCLIAFVCYTIGVLILPYEPTTVEIVSSTGQPCAFVIDISMEQRIYTILTGFVMVSLTYFVFAIFPNRVYYKKQLNYFFYAILLIGACFVIHSWITEFDKYIATMKTFVGDELTLYENPKSVFLNRNNYAFVLFMCIVAALYLNQVKPRFYWYIVILFFYANIFLTLCKTLTLIAPCAILAYMFFRFFITFKEHKVRNIVAMSIIGTIVTAALLIAFLSLSGRIRALEPLYIFYHDVLIGVGSRTLNARFRIWDIAIVILANTNYIFGLGVDTIEPLLTNVHYIPSGERVLNNYSLWYMHNGYLQMFSYGGFIMIILIAIVCIYLVRVMIKTYRFDKSLVSLTGILIIATMVYMIVESYEVIFVTSLEHFVMMVTIVVPLLARYNMAYRPSLSREIVYIEENKKDYQSVPRPNLFKTKVFSSIILTLGSSILAISLHAIRALGSNVKLLLILLAILIFVWIFISPYLFSFLSKNHRKTPISHQESVLNSVIPNLVISLISFFFSLMFAYGFNANSVALQVIIPFSITLAAVLLISFIPSLAKTFGYDYLYDKLNDVYIKVFAKYIKNDPLYVPIAEKTKKNVTFVYSISRDEFAESIIKLLPSKTVYLITNDLKLTRYEKVYLKRYHKVVTPNTMIKMDDVLSASYDYKITSFVVIDGDIIDKKFLHNFRAGHPKAVLSYVAHKRNYHSSEFIKIFDNAYLVDGDKDKKLASCPLNKLRPKNFKLPVD